MNLPEAVELGPVIEHGFGCVMGIRYFASAAEYLVVTLGFRSAHWGSKTQEYPSHLACRSPVLLPLMITG